MVETFMHIHLFVPWRQWIPPVLLDRGNQKHVRRDHVQIKVLCNILDENRWGKWPESFPVFDFQVEPFLHFRMAGISKNAPVPKCPGAKFHFSLKPACNFPLCQISGYITTERREIIIFFIWGRISPGDPLNVYGCECGAQEGTLHGIPTRSGFHQPFLSLPDMPG